MRLHHLYASLCKINCKKVCGSISFQFIMEYVLRETNYKTRKIATLPRIHGQLVSKYKQLSTFGV